MRNQQRARAKGCGVDTEYREATVGGRRQIPLVCRFFIKHRVSLHRRAEKSVELFTRSVGVSPMYIVTLHG